MGENVLRHFDFESFLLPLKDANFGLFYVGLLVSRFGDFFGNLAFSILVYRMTSSPMALGLTWIVFLTPALLVEFFGGVYVDRWDRRRILVVVDLMQMIIFLGIALAYTMHSLELWIVYVASALVGSSGALFYLANKAILPSLVQKEAMTAANSMLETTFQTLRIISPTIAGFLIVLFDVQYCFAFNGLTSLISVFVWVRVKLAKSTRAEKKDSWAKDFVVGLKYYGKRPVLIWLAVLISAINFVLAPLMYTYILVFANDIFKVGPEGYGVLQSSLSAGFVFGAIVVGLMGRTKKRRELILSSLFGVGFSILLFSVTNSFLIALTLIGSLGFAIPFANITITAFYQGTIPEQMLGRAFGVETFLSGSLAPLGIGITGLLSDLFPPQQLVFFLGVAVIVIAIFGLLIPALKELDHL